MDPASINSNEMGNQGPVVYEQLHCSPSLGVFV